MRSAVRSASARALRSATSRRACASASFRSVMSRQVPWSCTTRPFSFFSASPRACAQRTDPDAWRIRCSCTNDSPVSSARVMARSARSRSPGCSSDR